MNKRTFNKIINSCVNKKTKLIDELKVVLLDDATKDSLVKFIVRNRGPVLLSMIPKAYDRSWLACCGYLHQTKGEKTGLTFLHTAAHQIK